jgi:hypothetical protein
MEQKIYYDVLKSLGPVPLMIQINSVKNLKSHFHKVYFNVIHPSTPRSSEWLLIRWERLPIK